MANFRTWMPHDLEVAGTYLTKTLHPRSIIQNAKNSTLTPIVDQLTSATLMFGRCELYMREAERNRLFGSDSVVNKTSNGVSN
jgi:hypothetical protein